MKLVSDSACDINDRLRSENAICRVPLSIRVGNREFTDDDALDVEQLLKVMKESSSSPETASPSPGDYLREYLGQDSVFVVTLSAKLSASYASAVLAAKMALEQKVARFVHVFDSKTASVGETLVNLKISELIRNNCGEMEIVEKVSDYIKSLKTFCLLESLDNLVKSGRVSKFIGRLSSILSVRLILGGTEQGTIELVEKVRGAKRAARRLIDLIEDKGERLEERICGIAHVNCREKAEALRDEILKRFRFRDVIIVDASGITAVYGNEGGVVLAF